MHVNLDPGALVNVCVRIYICIYISIYACLFPVSMAMSKYILYTRICVCENKHLCEYIQTCICIKRAAALRTLHHTGFKLFVFLICCTCDQKPFNVLRRIVQHVFDITHTRIENSLLAALGTAGLGYLLGASWAVVGAFRRI